MRPGVPAGALPAGRGRGRQRPQWAPPTRFGYQKDKGLVFETRGGNTSLWLGLRLQLRYTNLPGDPVVPDQLAPGLEMTSA